MERDHLTRLIDEPARVRTDDLADLRAMAERYPWFSGAHLLLVVGGHRQGDVLIDEQLRTTAAHLPSRAVLFDLVHASEASPAPAFSPTLEVVRDTPAPKPEALAQRKEELVTEPVVEVPAAVEQPVVIAPATPVVAEVAAPVEADVHSAPEVPVQPEEPAVEAAPKVDASTAEPAPDPLDLLYRQAALASSYELLMEHPAIASAPSLSDPAPSSAPRISPPAVATPVPVPPVTSGTQRFSDWLNMAAEPPSAPLPAGQRLDQLAPATDAQDWLHQPEIPKAPAVKPVDHDLDTKALIERFIQQSSTTPSPKKAEFYTPQLAGKRSLEDHVDMVTETLARIHEKQGNFQKAIAAYERLAIKHPQRSAYFRGLAAALAGR
jgi:hypothetical protein